MPLIFLSSLKDRIRCQRAKPFRVKFFTALAPCGLAPSLGRQSVQIHFPLEAEEATADRPTDRPTAKEDRPLRQRASSSGRTRTY